MTYGKKVEHIEWLLYCEERKKFYTIQTEKFGGGGILDSHIIFRHKINFDLLKVGERKVKPRPRVLGCNNLYPCTLSREEIESRYYLYGNYYRISHTQLRSEEQTKLRGSQE